MPRTDQPSGVRTKDVPRPPDNSVVTDELQASGQGEAAAGKPDKKSGKQAGSNDEDSAARNPKEGDDQNSQQPRRDRHAEKRIRKLNRRLAAERDRNTANEGRIQKLEQELGELKKARPANAEPEPQLKDFKSPQEYAKAYAKWEGARADDKSGKRDDDTRERKPPAKRNDPPAREEVADQEDVKAFAQRGKKKLGDEFLEAMESASAKEFAVSRVMGDFILEHELGPEIFVYLADNPELSRRIYDKSETFAVKELRKLAAKAKAGTLADSDPGDHAADDEESDDDERDESRGKGDELERRQTKAPKPKESGDDRGQPNAVVDLDDLDMDAYAERRRKQEQARRRF